MSHKLDIGVCSYRNPEKLKRAIEAIDQNTRSDFKLTVWHNSSPDDEHFAALEVLKPLTSNVIKSPNVGYAGAVNGLIAASTAPYFAYFDNDTEVLTPGWDERMIEVLEQNPECGQVFPGAGHFGFFNGRYHECLWNAGYCWMMSAASVDRLQRYEGQAERVLDTKLGHHEEVDLMIRLRLAGFQIGCVPDVQVLHHETATRADDATHKPGGRIHDGVVRFMMKWSRYFCGDVVRGPLRNDGSGLWEKYPDNFLRYTDWPPCALYLERWTLAKFPDWNTRERRHYEEDGNPGDMRGYRVVNVPGVGEMDAIEILKPKGYYRGRAI